VRLRQWADLAYWSFLRLEARQYAAPTRSVVVVNSRMVRDHFLGRFPHLAGRLRLLPSAIDPARLAAADGPALRAEGRRRWGLPPGHVVGLFAAMNHALKGLEPLLCAVRRLPADRFRLLVAGQPPLRRWRALVRWYGVADRVCFIGPQADMRPAYQASDFLVHPTFYDPCSLVVLEALACGLPVITSRANGASEFLSGGREGFVLDDPRDRALPWCMHHLLDERTRAKCALAARETARAWTFEGHYRQLLAILCEARRPASAAVRPPAAA
jgi:UDP-glucose:(heptosyl)LPS alpha-1,3-glucosyltransferase